MNFDAVKHLFKPIGPAELERLVASRYGHSNECGMQDVDRSVGLDDVGLEEVARVVANEAKRARSMGRIEVKQEVQRTKSVVQQMDARRSGPFRSS